MRGNEAPLVLSTSITTTTTRLKREDCKRTKHDPAFTKWKILIGPSDWEDHSLGKEGADRYRFHNLPNCASCAGVYEFGIAVSYSQSGLKAGKLDPDHIIPVYLGQSDNVRARLQRYGQAGAHLENGNSTGELIDSVRKGPGLFTEIFSRGLPIVFRWAPMKDKADAEKTEARLLNRFDYAWNKGSNGARRRTDILQKLDRSTSGTSNFPALFRKLQTFRQKRVGIKIEGCGPFMLDDRTNAYPNQENYNLLSQIFKFGRSNPRLVSSRFDVTEDRKNICGVALGRGSVCCRPPVEGRKRCSEHKGLKVNSSISKLITEDKRHYIYGPVMESSTCRNDYDQLSSKIRQTGTVPSQVFSERPVVKKECDTIITICGVDLNDGTFCTRRPVVGRKRCEEHKGMRLENHMSKSSCNDWKYDNTPSKSVSYRGIDNEGFSTTCGATLGDGSFCRRPPVEGRKRCWQHKGMRVNSLPSFKPTPSESVSYRGIDNEGFSPTCGATLGDGSFCRRPPGEGKKRCWQHTGMRVNSSPSYKPTSMYEYEGISSHICGAGLQNGSICRRTPVHGRKRCEQHKGKRAATTY